MQQILQNLKSTGLKLNLWNSSLLDRMLSDYILHTKLEVKGVLGRAPQHRNKLRCKYHDQIPVKLLPNCASYKAEKNKLSWLNGLFNLVSRSSKSSGIMIGWVNTRRNGWLMYMFNYLGHLRDNGKSIKYWKTAQKLLKSPTYQISCFHATCPDWHTSLSSSEVERILKQVNNIILTKQTTIDYRRVYIPKPNGKYRPLGVPTLAWRVYLHMLNNLIVWWKLGQEPTQHGYLPKKGVLTCWSQIFPKLTSSRSVYEFDLKGFFDNVDLDNLNRELSDICVPPEILQLIGSLNRSIVKLTKKDEIDESSHRNVVLNSDGHPNPNLPTALKEKLISASKRTLSEFQLEVGKLVSKGYSLYRTSGVPQGAATSCGLSTLSLRQLYSDFLAYMYADDGVIFDAITEPSCTYPKAGIFKESTKSGWVKQDGQFLTSLKFLGLEYIPSNIPGKGEETKKPYPRLRSNTRSGAQLEFDTKLQFLCFLSQKYKELYTSLKELIRKIPSLETLNLEQMDPQAKIDLTNLIKPTLTIETWIERCLEEFQGLSSDNRLGLLFTTPAGPVTLSRMYNDSLDLLTVSDTKLVFTKRSWVSTKWGSYLYRFGLTSFYRSLVNHLEKNDLVYLPDHLKEFHHTFPTTELFLSVYNSLFKGRDLSSVWKLGENSKFDFKQCRLYLKWYLKAVKLSLTNSSTFACDDLLSYIKINGSITGWKHNDEVKYCKAGFIEYVDPREHEVKFDSRKEYLLKAQRIKLKKELRTLHKELEFGPTNPFCKGNNP